MAHATAPRAPPALARRLLSFELAFVLFLFAGVYKAWAPISWIPADPTVLFGGLVGLSLPVVWVRAGMPRPPVALTVAGLFGLFLAYALLSGLWSESGIYYREKAFRLVTATALSLLGALALSQRPARTRRFLALAAGFSVLVTLGALTSVAHTALVAETSTPRPFGTNYLIVGRAIGFGAVILAAALLCYPLDRRERLGAGIALLLALVALVGLGGRGPLVATVASIGAVGAFATLLDGTLPRLDRRALVAGIGGLGLLGVLLVTVGRSIRGVYRFLILLESPGDSLGARLGYYDVTLDLWLAGPTVRGAGLGSWPIAMGRGDERGYPHNVVLELLYELGLVGAALFFALLAVGLATLVRGWRAHRRPEAVAIGALCLFTLLNAMVTGDLNDNRFLFAIIGLLCYRPVAGSASSRS
ncbi:MAG: O-antigen ligase family protein [Halalkalicoccus sp.]